MKYIILTTTLLIINCISVGSLEERFRNGEQRKVTLFNCEKPVREYISAGYVRCYGGSAHFVDSKTNRQVDILGIVVVE